MRADRARVVRRLAFAGLAAVLVACTTPPPPPPPPSTAAVHTGLGFDACAVQSNTNAVSRLQAWLSSPYRAVGLYLGGRDAGCPTTWSPTTMNSVRSMGWRIIPIYVDLQAPCFNSPGTPKIPVDYPSANAEGINAANAAAARMQALGLNSPNAPIYLDIEGYPAGGGCTDAVRWFVNAWSGRLHELNYLPALYSSASSGIADFSASYAGTPAFYRLDAIWFADWRCPPNSSLLSENKTWLPDNVWTNHQRLRQYQGGTRCDGSPNNETYGGVTLNIDNDNLDGPVIV